MSAEPLRLPSDDDWRRWGVEVADELHAGRQSRVFDAVLDGERGAVKLTDARFADASMLGARLEAVEALGARHPGVVAPIRIGGVLVQEIGEWLMTATSFIEGEQLEPSEAGDADLLGRSLSSLHTALSSLESFEIPQIAALSTTRRAVARSGWQLLHGDFSTQNVIATAAGLRIFDFDDCGYGPVDYDLANSLYMVLFDADVTDAPDRYEVFRSAFLTGYAHNSNRRIDETAIDEMIQIRVEALGRWLDDLPSAPVGIRTSSPEWLDTLASFVARQGRAPGSTSARR